MFAKIRSSKGKSKQNEEQGQKFYENSFIPVTAKHSYTSTCEVPCTPRWREAKQNVCQPTWKRGWKPTFDRRKKQKDIRQNLPTKWKIKISSKRNTSRKYQKVKLYTDLPLQRKWNLRKILYSVQAFTQTYLAMSFHRQDYSLSYWLPLNYFKERFNSQ